MTSGTDLRRARVAQTSDSYRVVGIPQGLHGDAQRGSAGPCWDLIYRRLRGSMSSIGTFFPSTDDPQRQADVAVVMPTIGRAVLGRALTSIFDQDHPGSIQVLLGFDQPCEISDSLRSIIQSKPDRISVLLMQLPYSTSVRHGGVHMATDGGATRSILSFMANSSYVAYLDDDNEWERSHLRLLLGAVVGKAWAFGQRMLIDEITQQPMCVDRWDSVGPYRGRFADRGGLVDTNCILVDKTIVGARLGCWSQTPTGQPSPEADRNFFASIKDEPFGEVAEVTVRYGVRYTNKLFDFFEQTLPPADAAALRRRRLQWQEAKGRTPAGIQPHLAAPDMPGPLTSL